MIRKSSLAPAKVIIGILSIVIGLFLTLFGGIAFLFRSFGGVIDFTVLGTGLIFMFTGIWMTLNAFFSDVEVRIENLDELAAVMGRRVQKCKKCGTINPATAAFCMRCGTKFA